MNLKKRVLFIDADECLLNWLGAFCDWYNKRYGEVFIKPEQFTDYAMSGFPGGEENRVKLMKEFSYTAEYADLPALCQMTSLEALVNVGYELRVLTARVDPHLDQRAKLVYNLTHKYGGVFSGVHFLPHTKEENWTKLGFMRYWGISGNGYAVGLIDDKPETLREIAEDETFEAFGIKHEFNRSDWERPKSNGIQWFNSIDHVANMLVQKELQRAR